MEAKQFIEDQLVERQDLLQKIHQIVLENDETVEPVVEPMMGKEMIIYKAKGSMKYALSAVKKYMSLHVLPMYMNVPLHSKYQGLLPKASFQKGCINFTGEDEVQLAILTELIKECAPIDLAKIREDYLLAKKQKSKQK